MASSVVGAVRVVLGLDSAAFTKGMTEAQRQLQNAGKQMQAIGRQMSLKVTAPIVGFGALTLRAAGNFEAAMNQVAAVSGATGEEFAALTAQAKELGATTQYTAAQAGDAMGFLAMAGMEANDILAAMPDTLQLAAAAQLDMARAADIVTNILAGYNMDVEQLGRATDVLVKSFTSANTDLSQLADAMKYAGPVANAAGVQFEEAAAALSLMGNAGIQGSMAGTSLRGAISRILNPTNAMASAMEGAGLSFSDASGRLLPLADIIEQLEPHADNAGLFMELFGQRAGPAMAALVTQGSDAVRELTGELENSAGVAGDVAAVQMQGFNGALRQLAASFEALQLAIADAGLLQWASDVTMSLAGFFQEMSRTNPELLRMGTIVAGVVAAIGPMLVVLGTLATALAALGTVAGGVVIAIAAISAAVVTLAVNWGSISEAFPQGAAVIEGAIELIKGSIAGLIERVSLFGTGIIRLLTGDLAGAWEAAKALVVSFSETFYTLIETVFPSFRSAISDIIGAIGDFLSGAWAQFEAAWDGMLAKVGEVKQGIADFAEQIPAFFADLPARMLKIGVDIVQGLWNGIQSKWGEFTGWASGLGDQIAGFFTNPLQIFSPSRVMHGIGVNVMEGLDNGMDSMASQVEQTAKSIAQTVTQAFTGLINGSQTVGDAISSVMSQLGQMFLSQGFQALFGMGGGGGIGGLFSGLFSGLLGFARGGTIMPGGSGGIDSQLVMFRKSPNERVDITKPGQSLASGNAPSKVEITVNVDGARGNIEIQQMVSQGVAQGMKAVERNFGNMLGDYQMRNA